MRFWRNSVFGAGGSRFQLLDRASGRGSGNSLCGRHRSRDRRVVDLVLILSEHAVASAHVGREIERAVSKRHPVIALRIDSAPLTAAFEYFLNQSQWIEGGGSDAAVAQLVGGSGSICHREAQLHQVTRIEHRWFMGGWQRRGGRGSSQPSSRSHWLVLISW